MMCRPKSFMNRSGQSPWGTVPLLICLWAVLAIFSPELRAQSPDDQFMLAYNLIQQAEKTPDAVAAQKLLKTAQSGLLQLQRNYPTWNERVVRYRLRYIADHLTRLQDTLPTTSQPTAPGSSPSATSAQPGAVSALEAPPNEVLEHFNELNRQIRNLTQERQTMEAKLREALSAQPTPIDPREFQEALSRVNALQATNQVLIKQIEAQARERQDLIDRVVAEETQHALEETRRQLARQETLVSRLEQERVSLQERLEQLLKNDVQPLKTENQALKRQVQELQSTAERDGQVAALAGELAQLQQQLDVFRQENEQLASEKHELERQLAQFVARDPEGGMGVIAKLEAELAVAQADVARQTQRMEDLDGALEIERSERKRLAEENSRLQQQRAQAAQPDPVSLKALQDSLEEERSDKQMLQSQLQAALAQVAAAHSGNPALALASLNLLSQQAAVQEVSDLRNALRESHQRELQLQSLLEETESLKSQLEADRNALQRRLTALAAQPPLNPLPDPEGGGHGIAPTDVLILEARIRRLESERTDLERRILALTRTALETKPKRRFFPSMGSRED